MGLYYYSGLSRKDYMPSTMFYHHPNAMPFVLYITNGSILILWAYFKLYYTFHDVLLSSKWHATFVVYYKWAYINILGLLEMIIGLP
jgi:hypothetical protein